MTSSAEARPRIEPLPPALSSIWRLCKLGYRHEPRLIVTAFTVALLAALPDALLAYWFKLLGDGVLQGDWSRVRVAVLALGISATATWFLVTVSTRVQRRFRDKVTIALESHVATLLASITTIAHHERPEYLDRLSVLRNQVFMLDHMYMSLFSTCGWILRLAVTVALLVSIHPALALLTLCALPPVLTSSWRPGVERRAQERGAAANRLSRHVFDVATTASPGKDVRVTGIADLLMRMRRADLGGGSGADRDGALGLGGVACGGVGGLRRRLRRRDRLRHLRDWRAGGRRAAHAGRRIAALVLCRRRGRRDRLPARCLDGRGAAPGLARGLCGVGRGHRRPAVAPAPGAGRAVRSRLVRLSGHRPAGARRRVARLAGRHGGGDRRRERRREDDAGEAARQAVCRRPAGASWSTARISRRSRPSTGARAWPAPSRTSSASSSPPATRSAWAICRASTTARR